MKHIEKLKKVKEAKINRSEKGFEFLNVFH